MLYTCYQVGATPLSQPIIYSMLKACYNDHTTRTKTHLLCLGGGVHTKPLYKSASP